jgi:hypothetical protein
MATTSNAAMRKKMPRRKYPWGAPFHVLIFLSHSTSAAFRGPTSAAFCDGIMPHSLRPRIPVHGTEVLAPRVAMATTPPSQDVPCVFVHNPKRRRPSRDGLLVLLSQPMLHGLLGHSNRSRIKSDCRLRQQPAVDRCEIPKCDRCLTQYNSLKVRVRSNGHSTGDLPEDVLGQCTTA